MSDGIGVFAVLVGVMGTAAYLLFHAGRACPRVGYALGALSLLSVLALWVLISVDEADGPGGGLGRAMAGAASLVFLAGGMALIAGAMATVAPLVGLGLGLAVSGAMLLWLVPSAEGFVGPAILVLFSLAGCLVPAVRRKIGR